MGIEEASAAAALRRCGGSDVSRAVEFCFSHDMEALAKEDEALHAAAPQVMCVLCVCFNFLFVLSVAPLLLSVLTGQSVATTVQPFSPPVDVLFIAHSMVSAFQ